MKEESEELTADGKVDQQPSTSSNGPRHTRGAEEAKGQDRGHPQHTVNGAEPGEEPGCTSPCRDTIEQAGETMAWTSTAITLRWTPQ